MWPVRFQTKINDSMIVNVFFVAKNCFPKIITTFGYCNSIAGTLFNYTFLPFNLLRCLSARLPQLVTGKRSIAVFIANNVDGSYCRCVTENSPLSETAISENRYVTPSET